MVFVGIALAYLILSSASVAARSEPPAPADAQAVAFAVPVACDMDRVCSIQKYVDHDPGPERMDYACGRLSLDGDTGTDFRVPDLPTMAQGVPVVAAAPGVVRAVRDGMVDISVGDTGRETIRGREAGNGVVIDHGNEFETQYSHLRQGSVAVSVGQKVGTGQKLGLIGLSGNTEFPHVEFSVRYRGQPVDPFVGLGGLTHCGDPHAPLWSEAALARLPYRATVLLSAGFAAEQPDARSARHGAYAGELGSDPAAVVVWVDVSGTLAGDLERYRVEGPGGTLLLEREQSLSANNISWFSFAGLRRPPDGWPAGPLVARYALIRGGETVIDISRSATLAEPP